MSITNDLPNWRDERSGGAMVRSAIWLVAEVGVGQIFTKAALRKAVPNREQVDRRMRDLRKYGWKIDDNKQDDSLQSNQLRFVEQGVEVWNSGARRAARPATITNKVRQEVFVRDGHRCVRCGAQAGEYFADQSGLRVTLTAAHVYPESLGSKATVHDLVTACQRCNEPLKQHTANYLDGKQVWQRIRDVGIRDKRQLLKWIDADRRDIDQLEVTFGHFRQLPAAERNEIQLQLRQLLSGS